MRVIRSNEQLIQRIFCFNFDLIILLTKVFFLDYAVRFLPIRRNKLDARGVWLLLKIGRCFPLYHKGQLSLFWYLTLGYQWILSWPAPGSLTQDQNLWLSSLLLLLLLRFCFANFDLRFQLLCLCLHACLLYEGLILRTHFAVGKPGQVELQIGK